MIETIDSEPVANALLVAPAWQRLGIAVSDERLRKRAADALARSILEQLARDQLPYDPRQLSLSL
ncbi:DUF6771 family protein [uncultured Sphingomonas sp.]|uniref:DUF6771 family protein n=1 Tax=uncultured Sphingomonas sp. TaxID=158754 RepID=UPI003747E55E